MPRATLTYILTLDPEENLHHFEYHAGSEDIYVVTRDSDGKLECFKKKTELNKYIDVISGQVEDSLFKSITDAGGDASIVSKLANIFAWEIDFHKELRRGDIFRFVVEKYLLDGTFVRYGEILAAKYKGTCIASSCLGFVSGLLHFLGYLLLSPSVGEEVARFFLQGTLYGTFAAIIAVLGLFITSKWNWEESFFYSSFFYFIIILGVSLLFVSVFNGIRTIVLFLL